MKKEFTKKVKKLLPNKSFMVLLIVFTLIFAIGLSFTLMSNSGVFLPESQQFDRNGEENVYSSFKVKRITDSYAKFTDENGKEADYAAYFSINDEGSATLIMNNEDFTALSNIYKFTVGVSETEPEAVTVYGMSAKMNDELIDTATKNFRVFFNIEDSITDEQLADAVGTCYLDVGYAPASPIGAISAIVMFIGIAGVLAVLGLKISMLNNQKNAEKGNSVDYNDVISQLQNAYINKTTKTIMTDDYIVGSGGLGVYGAVKKSDIIWVYSKVGRVNLQSATQNIYAGLRDGTFAVCASCPSNAKNNEIFNEVKTKIFEALPEALVGYTKDNMVAAQKITDEFESK